MNEEIYILQEVGKLPNVAELARALENDYGRGFAEKNLRRMVQFG